MHASLMYLPRGMEIHFLCLCVSSRKRALFPTRSSFISVALLLRHVGSVNRQSEILFALTEAPLAERFSGHGAHTSDVRDAPDEKHRHIRGWLPSRDVRIRRPGRDQRQHGAWQGGRDFHAAPSQQGRHQVRGFLALWGDDRFPR